MTRLLTYLLFFCSVLYLLAWWGRRQIVPPASKEGTAAPKANRWFRPKRNPREIWVQVYETATAQEGQMLQARLQEEEIECILYEQGRKDIHGNPLKGIGVAVPKSEASNAQRVVSRMPT